MIWYMLLRSFFIFNLVIFTFVPWTGAEDVVSIEPSRLSRPELKIWNDPAFQKQFAESYLAETEIEPRVTVDERDQMQKVLEFLAADEMEKAIKLLEKNRGATANALFDFTLGNVYFQREDFEQALNAYQLAVEKYPKFRRAWRNLGLIHVRQGQFEKALPALTRVIELGGGDALTYGLLGFAYSSVENNLPAESAYRMAILLDPETVDWKMGLARSLFKQERYAEAVALCSTLISSEPERADLWLLQANAYIGLNQPLKAAENYELVDRLGKSTVDSLNMLGDIYINEELYEMAVNSYIRVMEKDLAYNVAPGYSRRQSADGPGSRPGSSRKLLERVENLHAQQLGTEEKKEVLKLRARLAVSEGSGDEEARVLEEIVALDPLDGEALILLGQYNSRVGDTEKAIFYYERAAGLEKFEADAKVRHGPVIGQSGQIY